ncbi:hypothetical protein [Thermocrinis jamiesonii]|jgi:hypothetical protein|uniref:hypothetical protein n=1 Tax=Thermocrinis jamiesonii TaxID=1302351 RepID=UPI00049622B5|nr:hypothetical protein [Thermocrinis jamiesonii]
MDSLIAWVVFIVKLLIVLIIISIPLLLIIVALSNFLYKKIEPKYEEMRRKRMRELGEKEQGE